MEKKIKDSNVLIAEFMGYKIENKKFQFMHEYSSNESSWEWDEGEIVTLNGYEVSDENNEPYFNFEDLPFDTSWDWLMPIIEKIENSGELENIFTQPPRIVIENGFVRLKANIGYIDNKLEIHYNYSDYTGFGGLVRKNNNFTHKSKIEAVYNAIVEFIKWYNENDK